MDELRNLALEINKQVKNCRKQKMYLYRSWNKWKVANNKFNDPSATQWNDLEWNLKLLELQSPQTRKIYTFEY